MCLPLVVIAGLGWRLARHEHDTARQRLSELLLVRLRDNVHVLDDYFQRLERRLEMLCDSISHDPETIRSVIRRDPHIGQLFILNANGALIHPSPRGALNATERRFIRDYQDVILSGNLMPSAIGGGHENTRPPSSGWVVRFHGPGANLFYRQRLPSGQVVGVLLRRARWIADLIAELPDTVDVPGSDGDGLGDARTRLVDSSGRSVYQWGSYEPEEGAVPLQELAPSYPLASWRLQQFVDGRAFAAFGRGAYFNLLSTLAAAGLALVMAGAWFYRQYNRQVREATQRVSFVNQVSHELRTPLTNIRMYAELLEHDLIESGDEQSAASRDHLKVIVAESQRLSRLIGNVLTFAQQQRGLSALRLRPAVIDDVVASVIQRFDPALRRRGIDVEFHGAAGDLVEVDVEALEQILGNLFGNVEKYASSGKRVEITSRRMDDITTILFSDDGPGIPARHGERIFRPFQRLSNDIAHSPGTGIGLTIARQLARLHGGDLRLLPSERGARFELRLRTKLAESETSP